MKKTQARIIAHAIVLTIVAICIFVNFDSILADIREGLHPSPTPRRAILLDEITELDASREPILAELAELDAERKTILAELADLATTRADFLDELADRSKKSRSSTLRALPKPCPIKVRQVQASCVLPNKRATCRTRSAVRLPSPPPA